MSNQRFSAAQREAIWLAHEKKCAYTRELLDVSSLHVDHVIPEGLANEPNELDAVKARLELPSDFDILGYENLLPCRPGPNLQKGAIKFDSATIRFFLGIAASKKHLIEAHLERIDKRNARGKALILLQQCLERGDLNVTEVSQILEEHGDNPGEIFTLLEGMSFADETEIYAIKKTEIKDLLDRPIRLGPNDDIDGVTLTKNSGETVHVRTCNEYWKALGAGYYPYSTFDIKMATYFEHQCGLMSALETAATPVMSFVENPRVGVVDLELLPFSLFPQIGDVAEEGQYDRVTTYQDKVTDGSLIVTKLRHNLLQVVDNGLGHQLVEVARADFNGDGVEDVLLFEYCWATGGTLGFGGIRILTRMSADALFEPIEAKGAYSRTTQQPK